MAFGLLNSIMLFGMFALAIPIIIHLLNRRRFDVVDWGAMRFLHMSETTRRRVFIEEVLLMLLRMGLIALLVLAMCAPFASSAVFEWFGFVDNRDIVLVFDGSTDMSYTDGEGKTDHEHAVDWAKNVLDQLTPGDTVAIIQARVQTVSILASTSDLNQARAALDQLAPPAGNCNWPNAVETAHEILLKSKRTRRDVVLLGVGRKEGWADVATVKRWRDLVPQFADGKQTMRVWMVPFAEKRPIRLTEKLLAALRSAGVPEEVLENLNDLKKEGCVTANQFSTELSRVFSRNDQERYLELARNQTALELPNWALTGIEAGTVGTTMELTFRTGLRVQGQEKYAPPYQLRYEIDQPPWQPRYKLTDKALDHLRNGQVPEAVLRKLGALKDKEFVTEEQFWTALASVLDKEDLAAYQDRLIDHARINPDAIGGAISVPESDDLKNGRLPLTFAHKLPGPGSHLVSVIVQPDAPKYRRVKGAPIVRRDWLEGDNRRDFAVMVPLLPVLIVDGLPPPEKRLRKHKDLVGGDALRIALEPLRFKVIETGTEKKGLDDTKTHLVRAKVSPLQDLEEALKRNVGPEENTRPRVLVLCDVPELTAKQQEVVDAFVKDGGGLLMTVGGRLTDAQERVVDAIERDGKDARPQVEEFLKAKVAHYNNDLFRSGSGWLPARLEKQVGDENEPEPNNAKDPDRAAHPLPKKFLHPALVLFQNAPVGGIERARFPKWWQLALSPGDTRPLVASLVIPGAKRDTKEMPTTPWLVEKKKYGKGSALLCSVPLDDTWGTNFHTRAVPEYALLVNKLIAHLADTDERKHNVEPGQPLVCPLLDDERGASAKSVLKTPRGETVALAEKDGAITYTQTRLPGVYVLTTPRNRTVYFVVKSGEPFDADEMTALTEKSKQEVAEVFRRGGAAAKSEKAAEVSLTYTDDAAKVLRGPDRDVWWLFLVGVTLLLCSEVWMTRRIAKGR